MTVLPVYGGPLKRDIIDRAYSFCGQSTAQYELSPEEYVAGLRVLNDQMALLPNAPYNAPQYGDGSPQDESGLALDDVLGAAVYTAQLLAGQIGKQLTLSAPQSRAASVLIAKYQSTPFMQMGRGTIRGAGNSRYYGGYRSPFFYTPVSDAEPAQ